MSGKGKMNGRPNVFPPAPRRTTPPQQIILTRCKYHNEKLLGEGVLCPICEKTNK
jgi:hypothetical protein